MVEKLEVDKKNKGMILKLQIMREKEACWDI